MKYEIGLFVIGMSLVNVVQSQRVTLPDACGDDRVKFTITTQKGPLSLSAPENGRAKIVFVEVDHQDRTCVSCNSKVRIGMDGGWVGASQGNSAFAITVTPGVHHLCANWQSASAVFSGTKVGPLLAHRRTRQGVLLAG